MMKEFTVFNKKVSINEELVKQHESVTHMNFSDETAEYLLVGSGLTNSSVEEITKALEEGIAEEIEAYGLVPQLNKKVEE